MLDWAMLIDGATREEIERVAVEHGLSLVVLFGSHARGDAHSGSDVDIAYLSPHPLSLRSETELAIELGEVLRDRVDLVNIGKASPLLRHQIFRVGRPLYERESGLFAEHLARGLRLYAESLPLYQLKQALL